MSKRISKHDRAIRGLPVYQMWRELAEFMDGNVKHQIPEVLRFIANHRWRLSGTEYEKVALDLLLKDRYPGFVVLERLRGKRKDER